MQVLFEGEEFVSTCTGGPMSELTGSLFRERTFWLLRGTPVVEVVCAGDWRLTATWGAWSSFSVVDRVDIFGRDAT